MLHTYLVLSNCTQRALVACCCCCCCCDVSISLMMELICVAARQSNTLRFQLPFRLANRVNANGSVRFAAAMLKALQFTVWLTVTHTPVCVCVCVCREFATFWCFRKFVWEFNFSICSCSWSQSRPPRRMSERGELHQCTPHTVHSDTHTHPLVHTSYE